MEMRQLRLFVAVADTGTFTAAAARLHTAQPSVSQQIALLERQLGAPLFHRGPRQVSLTEAGTALLPHARAVLSRVDIAQAAVRSTTAALAGTLNVGSVQAVDHLQLPTLLGDFHHRHPAVRMTLRIEGSARLIDALDAGHIDVALIAAPEPRLPRPLITRWLASEPLVALAPADHPIARRRRISTAELLNQPLVTLREGTGLHGLVQQLLADTVTEPQIVCATDALSTVVALVENGVGVALVPRSAVPSSIRAVVLPLGPPALNRHIALAWRRADGNPPSVTEFLDLADRHFAALLGHIPTPTRHGCEEPVVTGPMPLSAYDQPTRS